MTFAFAPMGRTSFARLPRALPWADRLKPLWGYSPFLHNKKNFIIR